MAKDDELMTDSTIQEVQDHYLEIKNRLDPRFKESRDYKEYRRMWHECPEKEIVPPLPINLDLHITNECNLKCTFCPRTWKEASKRDGILHGFMEFKLFKKIIDEASEGGVRAVHFTGNGEPLLHEGLEEMLRYCHEKRILEILMHTNATLLNQKRAMSLLQAGVHDLVISFDSPVKETYEKLRVGANFETTLNNIRNFVRLRDEGEFQYPRVRLQMVDQKANMEERERFEALFLPLADSVSHASFVNFNGGPQSDEYQLPTENIDGKKMDFDHRRLNEDFKCKYLWQRMIIEVEGEVYPCFYNDKLLLGNVATQSLKEIWTGPKMEELRAKHSAGKFDDIPECAGCGRQYEVCDDNLLPGMNAKK